MCWLYCSCTQKYLIVVCDITLFSMLFYFLHTKYVLACFLLILKLIKHASLFDYIVSVSTLYCSLCLSKQESLPAKCAPEHAFSVPNSFVLKCKCVVSVLSPLSLYDILGSFCFHFTKLNLVTASYFCWKYCELLVITFILTISINHLKYDTEYHFFFFFFGGGE